MPPSPPAIHFLDEEVADNEEGIDNDTDAAADDIAAAEDIAAAAAAADNHATMLPKVKPLTMKPTKKDMADASAKPPPPPLPPPPPPPRPPSPSIQKTPSRSPTTP